MSARAPGTWRFRIAAEEFDGDRSDYVESGDVLVPAPTTSGLAVTVLGTAVWTGGRPDWDPATSQTVRAEWVLSGAVVAWAEEQFAIPDGGGHHRLGR